MNGEAESVGSKSLCADCRRITDPASGLFLSGKRQAATRPTSKPTASSDSGKFRTRTICDRREPTGSQPRAPVTTACSSNEDTAREMTLKLSLHNLYESQEKGCACCSFFIRTILQTCPSAYRGGVIKLRRHQPEGKCYERLERGDYITLDDGDKELVRFGLLTTALNSLQDPDITRRPVGKSPRSQICHDYLTERLRDCNQNHRECSGHGEQYHPTRLLDLGDPRIPIGQGRVKLIITAERKTEWASRGGLDKYIALSHCWGSTAQKPLMATSKNFKRLQDGIPTSSLPATFRDVVETTRMLGFRYLWIDSLCILQDDRSDWAAESSRMADVYKHSVLTIATSSSWDSHQPILDKQRQMQTPGGSAGRRPRYFTLPAWNKQNFILQHPLVPTSISDSIRSHFSQPLSSRAWTLQERLLSRRTIFFDADQIFWECRTARYFEGWTLPVKKLIPPGMDPFCHVEKPDFNPIPLSTPSDEQSYNWWYQTLTEYHKRSLTVSTDALPALSGIAREFSKSTGDDYLAGIWQSNLFRGLSWRRELQLDLGGSIAHRHKRHILHQKTGPIPINECLAPSWSWACIQDTWKYNIRGDSWNGDVLQARRHSIAWKGSDVQPMISPGDAMAALYPKHLKTRIISEDINKVGHVQSALLFLRAACRKIVVTRRDLSACHPYGQAPGLFVFECCGVEPKAANQYIFPCVDHPAWLEQRIKQAEDQDRRTELTCMLLGRSSGLHCLLLYEATDEESAADGTLRYFRCGVLNIEYDTRPFEEGWEMKRMILQ